MFIHQIFPTFSGMIYTNQASLDKFVAYSFGQQIGNKKNYKYYTIKLTKYLFSIDYIFLILGDSKYFELIINIL